MNNHYNVYKPSKLIRDIDDTSHSYYDSEDINLSPFTKVGSLIKDPSISPLAPSHDISNKKPPVRPVFNKEVATLAFGRRVHTTAPIMQAHLHQNHTDKYKVIASRFRSLFEKSIYGISLWATSVKQHTFHAQAFPKKYTVQNGLKSDFSGKTFTYAKFATLGIVILFSLLVFSVVRHTLKPVLPHPVTYSHSPDIITATNTNNTQPNGTSNSNTTNNGTQSSNISSVPGNNNSLIPSAGGTTSPLLTGPSSNAGGYGGGSAPSVQQTATPSSGIPGVTVPYPITLPGQTVQSNGKQVVGTSPATITLN